MSNTDTQADKRTEMREKNIQRISLITGIILAIMCALSLLATIQNGQYVYGGVTITGLVSVAAFVSVWFSRRHRAELGIAVLIITILTVSLALPLVTNGQGIVLGLMVIILVTGIASTTLTPKGMARASVAAIVVGIIIALADLFTPANFGAPSDPRFTVPFSIILGIIYASFILSRFRTYSLRTKFIVAFLIVAITPLGILATINTRTLESNLRESANNQLQVISVQTASNLDTFIQTNLDILRTEAQNPDFGDLLTLSPDEHPGLQPEIELILTAMSRRDQVNILSYSILDINGIDIADSFPANIGIDISNQEYFQRAVRTGLPTISPIFYKDNSFYFSMPVRNSALETVGVLRLQYSASVLQQIIAQSADLSGAGSFAMLLDENHIFLANGAQPEVIFKSLIPLQATTLAALQKSGQLPDGTTDQFSANHPALEEGLRSGEKFLSIQESNPGEEEETPDVVAIASMKTRPWTVVYSLEQNILLEPLQRQTINTTLLALLISLAAAVSALLLSQALVFPLIRLTGVAEEITAGNLEAYATSTSSDEIGILANTFNSMTARLRALIASLEQRVSERTRDFENARQLSETRADNLQAISEISRIIATEQKLETLFPLITRLVSERFNYYHAGIFLINETKQFAVLQAANSQGGKNMLARGHRLEVGESGIVGYVAKFGVPRIALDVGLDAVYFNNPDLPTTRSEMALPLKMRGQTVGVLDVQSEQSGAFNENDANTLSILADQIAIALENARLFTQTQQALDEAQALYQQNVQEGWLKLSREEDSIGYHQSMIGGRKLTAPVEADEITQAMNRGSILVTNADGVTREPSIVVPIKLRGQIIGAMNIKAPTKDREWTGDEINLVEAISERLSLALENARLIQESQRQVIKEQTISEVTGKIGASINMKNVLQTAVEELGRAMPGSEVIIKFQSGNADKGKK